jgi:hypothetical protein
MLSPILNASNGTFTSNWNFAVTPLLSQPASDYAATTVIVHGDLLLQDDSTFFLLQDDGTNFLLQSN